MRKLTLEEVQSNQLEILKEVSGFCEKHKLTYFLCSGTMLGAIRHQGFIPWDDDIDISMPRPDYEQFKLTFKSEKFKLYDISTFKDYNKPYLKIGNPKIRAKGLGVSQIGINIDVFPLDGVPDSPFLRKIYFQKIFWLRKLLTIRNHKIWEIHKGMKALSISVFKGISLLFSEQVLIRKINSTTSKYKFGDSKKAGIVVWGYYDKEIFPIEVFSEQIDIKFESYNFKSVKAFDFYLTQMYADYMQLPPEEERKAHPIHYYHE